MTTWDPGNVSTHIALSNGNLTATLGTGNPSNYSNVLSTTSKSSGKWYFEVTITHASDTDTGWAVGVINGPGVILEGTGGGSFMGAQGNGVGANSAGGLERATATSFFSVNAGSLTTNPGWQQVNNPPTGDVIGVAVDVTNGLMWFQDQTLAGGWNVGTTGTQNPGTGQGGVSIGVVTAVGPIFIGVSLYYASSAVAAATLNPGSSSFTGTVPSGFSSWDPFVPSVLLPYVETWS